MPGPLLDQGQNCRRNQVCANDEPADRGNRQKIIDHTMAEIKQADITDHDCKNSCQAKADKP